MWKYKTRVHSSWCLYLCQFHLLFSWRSIVSKLLPYHTFLSDILNSVNGLCSSSADCVSDANGNLPCVAGKCQGRPEGNFCFSSRSTCRYGLYCNSSSVCSPYSKMVNNHVNYLLIYTNNRENFVMPQLRHSN